MAYFKNLIKKHFIFFTTIVQSLMQPGGYRAEKPSQQICLNKRKYKAA